MKTLQCQSYNIYFGDAQEAILSFLEDKRYSKIFLLVDDQTKAYCLPRIKYSKAHVISIPAGEKHKNIATCTKIWEALVSHQADRKSLMINLGGGVIGDMGGFCASTYMRGIDFVQVPTTLLSQVDASVGGKLGIDHNGLKNMVGLFRDPKAVIIDINMLETLPSEHIKSGYAEIIKHALIKDSAMVDQIFRDEDVSFETIVYENVSIKKAVVEQDPFEAGLRKILNFGHSIGHAVETQLLNTAQELLHGEAIAAGMICESHVSFQKSLITEDQLKRINNFLSRFYRGSLPKELTKLDQIVELMRKDKKNESGKFMLSLLDDIGSCLYNQVTTESEIHTALEYYNETR